MNPNSAPIDGNSLPPSRSLTMGVFPWIDMATEVGGRRRHSHSRYSDSGQDKSFLSTKKRKMPKIFSKIFSSLAFQKSQPGQHQHRQQRQRRQRQRQDAASRFGISPSPTESTSSGQPTLYMPRTFDREIKPEQQDADELRAVSEAMEHELSIKNETSDTVKVQQTIRSDQCSFTLLSNSSGHFDQGLYHDYLPCPPNSPSIMPDVDDDIDEEEVYSMQRLHQAPGSVTSGSRSTSNSSPYPKRRSSYAPPTALDYAEENKNEITCYNEIAYGIVVPDQHESPEWPPLPTPPLYNRPELPESEQTDWDSHPNMPLSTSSSSIYTTPNHDQSYPLYSSDRVQLYDGDVYFDTVRQSNRPNNQVFQPRSCSIRSSPYHSRSSSLSYSNESTSSSEDHQFSTLIPLAPGVIVPRKYPVCCLQ